MTLRVKLAYDAAESIDGCRILVDRFCSRGTRREELRIESWLREIAPSAGLRKWFGHALGRWSGFRRRHFAQLESKEELVAVIAAKAEGGNLTLVYGARDEEHNDAVALGEFLQEKLPD